jgi:hypothetical protein
LASKNPHSISVFEQFGDLIGGKSSLGAAFDWLGMPAALALSGAVVESDEPGIEPGNVAGRVGYSPAAS